MGVSEILASVDREIALLKQVRALLAGTAAVTAKKKVGRPKKAAAAVSPCYVKALQEDCEKEEEESLAGRSEAHR